MANLENMSRLNIAIPAELHRHIKAAASLEGKSLKDYVIERILPSKSDHDLEDVNHAIAAGLHEVRQHQAGRIKLPTYDEFLAQTK